MHWETLVTTNTVHEIIIVTSWWISPVIVFVFLFLRKNVLKKERNISLDISTSLDNQSALTDAYLCARMAVSHLS